MRRAAFPTLLLGLATLGCGPWQRVGGGDRPRPGTTLPRLFDAVSVYRSMGFWVTSAPLPFVASVHYLVAAGPDSTLAVFALSLANHALGFRRDGNEFVAGFNFGVFRTSTFCTAEARETQRSKNRGVGLSAGRGRWSHRASATQSRCVSHS